MRHNVKRGLENIINSLQTQSKFRPLHLHPVNNLKIYRDPFPLNKKVVTAVGTFPSPLPILRELPHALPLQVQLVLLHHGLRSLQWYFNNRLYNHLSRRPFYILHYLIRRSYRKACHSNFEPILIFIEFSFRGL